MPETQPEPLAAILREMRNPPHKWEGFSRADLAALADRIEAAAKWECESVRGARDMRDAMEYAFAQKTPKVEQSGNAAAMRDALESIIGNLAIHIQCGRLVAPGDHLSFAISEAEAYIRDARAALAAPARNCDRFATVKDAGIAFARERKDQPLPCPDFTFSAWIFAPAKGGAE